MKTSEGFATAAATMASLAISLVAVAVVAAAVAQFQLAQEQMTQARLRAALDGLHQRANLVLMGMGPGVRFHWVIATPSGDADASAESENAKLSLVAALRLSSTQLKRFGVIDVADLRRHLAAAAQAGPVEGLTVFSMDTAPIWKACARSAISPYGGDKLMVVDATSTMAPEQSSRRAGEVWRVRLTLGDWTDDRVVRFTGDVVDPAAVVERRFHRKEPAVDHCPPNVN